MKSNRTVEIVMTRNGFTIALFKENNLIENILDCGNSIRNPRFDWQNLLGYFADWIEDGEIVNK